MTSFVAAFCLGPLLENQEVQLAFIVLQFDCVVMGYSCVVSICTKNGFLQQKKGVGHLFNMFPS